MSHAIPWPYTRAELWADFVVHVLGIGLVAAGTVAFLVTRLNIDPAERLAGLVYLATLLASIGFSAAYNIWPVSPIKWTLRRFDHAAIFLLIAGTYTPFLVRVEANGLLFVVWGTALVGCAMKLADPSRYDRLAVLAYLLLGWSGVTIFDRLLDSLAEGTLALIVIGGVLYSLGTIFHLWSQLKFQNAIWHAFVLAAATTHFFAVWGETRAF